MKEKVEKAIVLLEEALEENEETATTIRQNTNFFLDNCGNIVNENKEIRLTKAQTIILNTLLTSKDLFCSHEELRLRLYKCNDNYTAQGIRNHIVRLNQLLKGTAEIKNIHSRGYRLELKHNVRR
ncbi:MAG: helix-turn-helix domain-containing protein [Clostridia bacterium]|nr:helix-turn-helix domain-containing protein [Clostridia bacterium]